MVPYCTRSADTSCRLQDEDEDKDEEPMTFGKFVKGFFYYCENPSKFAEELDRDERMSQLKQCSTAVIVDEVSCDGLQPIVLMFAPIILRIKQSCPFY